MSRHSRRGRPWARLRDVVIHRAGGRCQQPHCAARAAEVDHIQPLERGGTDSLANLQALCKQCHQDKTRRDRARPRDPAWQSLLGNMRSESRRTLFG